MYIRKSTRRYKDRVYTNYLLVESHQTPKGPRQKVICSLGDLSPRPRSDWLRLAHQVEQALVGQDSLVDETDSEVQQIVEKVRARQARRPRQPAQPAAAEQDEDLVSVHTDRVRTEQHREAGSVHVGHQFWKRLGLDEILAELKLSQRTRHLTCAMVMNRLIAPKSEHAMPDWIRRTALSDLLDVDFTDLHEDALYRNMDRLRPHRAAIESALVERERSLFNLDHTVFLYDLTSTYFEGLALANSKAKRGYSRDKRPDCKQVVVGLVLNRDGFPLAHDVLDGNVQDRQTVKDMLDLLDERVGLRPGQTVVVDRGMAFDENLEEIRSRKLHYVVASRQPERNQWLAEFEELEGFEEVLRQPSPRNPAQKKSQVRVKRQRHGDITHVLCLSSERVAKDRGIREKQEKRLLRDLDKLTERMEKRRLVKPDKIHEAIGRLKERYPRVARYYRMSYDAEQGHFSYELDEEKRGAAEQLDGGYLLKTDREDLSADETWRIYNLLTRVEAAFRDMKTPLAERPIFHQVARRVEVHIFLCVLAYHLLVAIEKTLRDKQVHTSWATVREVLSTHQVCTVAMPTDGGAVLRIRKGSTPEPEHVELYELLDVPRQVMRPRKTWSEPVEQRA